MTIKNRTPLLYDDYESLKNDNVDEEDAKRAVKHYIYKVENDKDVPRELLKFIAVFLKSNVEAGSITFSTGAGSGRPPEISANSYFNMLVWYRFNFIDEYTVLSKTDGDGRYYAVADSFRNDDSECRKALILDGRGYEKGMKISESTIKRALRQFQAAGLSMPGSRRADIQNEIQTETFFRIVISETDSDEIEKHQKNIISKWLEDRLKVKVKNSVNY